MTATAPLIDNMTLNVNEQTLVRASVGATFDAILEELGPSNLGQNDTPVPMVLEAWPGGRWFRDLGNGNGHLWGHVQSIKRPTLLELTGPLMMSFAVANNVQFRLKEVAGGTEITFHHSALGLFPDDEYREHLSEGFACLVQRLTKRLAAQ